MKVVFFLNRNLTENSEKKITDISCLLPFISRLSHFNKSKIFLTALLTIFILLGFALPLNPPNGFWYQQFMPNLHGARIMDIKFTDSLTGYAVTNLDSFNTASILKSTNGGDNWNIVFQLTGPYNFNKVQFLNRDTG